MDALTEQDRAAPPSQAETPGLEEPRRSGTEPPPPPREPPPASRRRRMITIAIVVIALLVIALLVFRGLHHGRQVPAGRRFGRGPGAAGVAAPVAVAVARASLGNIVVRIPALGTVTPLQVVTIQSQISGYLRRIDFKEGQMVRAGQLLAEIDPRPYEAALDQAKGNLARDSGMLAGAESDLARYQSLIKQDAVSEQQLVDQKYLVTQDKGAVEADKAAVAAAGVNLAYTRIVSPIAGRVGLRQVDAGNFVTPNEANGIVVVTQLEPISVIFPVAEDYIEGIQARLATGAKLRVEAYDRTDSTLLATGTLLTLDNQIDPTTGTVKLRAVFANANHILFPNQFVNVKLVENTLPNKLIIPTAAVRQGAPNGIPSSYVYIVNPNDTVSVRPIKTGITDGENIEVTSGLAEGDRVVTEGADRLRSGARVELPGQGPAAGPPEQGARAGREGAGAHFKGAAASRGLERPGVGAPPAPPGRHAPST